MKEQTKTRRLLIRAGMWFLLSLPFLGTPLILETVLRLRNPYAVKRMQACAKWGSPILHHYYARNCHSKMQLKSGLVRYSFNEDGLRERPRAFFSKGSIHVYGDSVLKGLFLNAEDTIPSLLEKRLGAKLGLPFLNAGFRFSSPTNQSNLFGMIAPKYPPKGLLVFLNGTDLSDEIFFRTQAVSYDEQDVPLAFSNYEPGWRYFVVSSLHQRFPRSLLAGQIITAIRSNEWPEKMAEVPKTEESYCGGLKRFARMAEERKIPYAFVFLPHWAKGVDEYLISHKGEKYDPAQLSILINCAKKTRGKVIDISPLISELKDEYFFPDFLHFRLIGVNWVVDHIENQVLEAFRPRSRRP